ncbi:hypothetical protein E0E54_07485 [Azotobacter chroococcum]|uniref:Uncharacterized protein n=1 Tax=Azotobacter chroococcum TaxID=353 RepID=A0A4Q9VNU4_9GAMM|nr:hypothetical protein [Azotobacter chroococcum]TBW12707.1 hypothetical protein E0E50_02280 [Azotobacter chroococcum subsp. isscasi]TBW37256.1 hypothetical protein E0E54_07485 [Azotobacter chroococcum]
MRHPCHLFHPCNIRSCPYCVDYPERVVEPKRVSMERSVLQRQCRAGHPWRPSHAGALHTRLTS